MIGVYSEINNITGISLYLEIQRLISVGHCWTMLHLEGYINTVHATEM